MGERVASSEHRAAWLGRSARQTQFFPRSLIKREIEIEFERRDFAEWCQRFAALGAAGAAGVVPRERIEMRPRHAGGHEFFEEQRRGDRAGKGRAAHVGRIARPGGGLAWEAANPAAAPHFAPAARRACPAPLAKTGARRVFGRPACAHRVSGRRASVRACARAWARA